MYYLLAKIWSTFALNKLKMLFEGISNMREKLDKWRDKYMCFALPRFIILLNWWIALLHLRDRDIERTPNRDKIDVFIRLCLTMIEHTLVKYRIAANFSISINIYISMQNESAKISVNHFLNVTVNFNWMHKMVVYVERFRGYLFGDVIEFWRQSKFTSH